MCFRSERSDAEEAAPLLGFPIDPFMLKPSATTTPHFYSATEQKEMHIQAITKLDKQEAFLRLPGDRLYRMQTLNVPDPVVPAGRLAELQQEYLNRYFRPQAAIEADMASMLQHDSWPGQPKPAGSDVAAGDIISFTPPAYAKNNIQSQTDDGDDEDDLTELRY